MLTCSLTKVACSLHTEHAMLQTLVRHLQFVIALMFSAMVALAVSNCYVKSCKGSASSILTEGYGYVLAFQQLDRQNTDLSLL